MNNFNNLKRSWRAYGGLACRKDGVIYHDEYYLMKFPANLKSKHLKGVNLSYANDTVNEFLGCNIFTLFGMEVQQTLLGIANDKIVVLCKDFAINAELIEFNKIKTSSARDIADPESGDSTDGNGTNINNTLEIIRNSMFFEGLPAEEFFWKMFIIDYIINNPDRNNGNWGILVKDGIRTLAPVYDCGNCLESKWDDIKCEQTLADEALMEDTIWRRNLSFFTDDSGSRIKPLELIKSNHYPICTLMLKEILECDTEAIYVLFNQCNYLTDIKKKFYCLTVKGRIDKLKEIYEKDLLNMILF